MSREYEPCEHCGKKPRSKKLGKPQNRRSRVTELCRIMGWEDIFRVMTNPLNSEKVNELNIKLAKSSEQSTKTKELLKGGGN